MDNKPDREYASRGEFVLRNPMGKSIVLIAATLVTLPSADAQPTPRFHRTLHPRRSPLLLTGNLPRSNSVDCDY
jgi:hypothetical protein